MATKQENICIHAVWFILQLYNYESFVFVFCILLRNQSMIQSLQVNIISYKNYVTNYNIYR